ncbi:hypothetical protein GUJ93_ZPchr0005g14323 [Zizania palustris]|uniref:Uncharacterized protein n=1 Tax=Zizania palustris TaxID=103762 RepID=A0A8J5SMB6_ZIZPA|nr:hypothetical protein GUJ93_ZPchr0005g14323 [Zizania palustris]
MELRPASRARNLRVAAGAEGSYTEVTMEGAMGGRGSCGSGRRQLTLHGANKPNCKHLLLELPVREVRHVLDASLPASSYSFVVEITTSKH